MVESWDLQQAIGVRSEAVDFHLLTNRYALCSQPDLYAMSDFRYMQAQWV